MNKWIKSASSALAAMAFAGMAHSAVIDFNALASNVTIASYSEQGVTFTSATGPSLLIAQPTGNGTLGIRDAHSQNILETRADIAGGATYVSVDLGDGGSDSDLLFLEVYDSANVLLVSTTLLIDGTDTTMRTLSAGNPNIAYAIFGSRAPSNGGSSVLADNFTFTPNASVPEPSSLALLGLALVGLAGVSRRKR